MRRPEQLTEAKRQTIVHALRVAADTFARDIYTLREQSSQNTRVWQQLERQAIESCKLADDLESALEVTVTYD